MAITLPGNLLDLISSGICIVDRNYTVILWNEYMEEYTGIRRERILQKNLCEFFPVFDKSLYRERIDSVFEGWPPVIFSSRLHEPFFYADNDYQQKSHQEVTITSYLPEGDNDTYAVFTITDVTDLFNKLKEQNELFKKAQREIESRKKAQDLLKVSESNLKELNATKDKFFSIIAHDLRGSFTGLLGFSELLLTQCEAGNFDQAVKYSRYMHEASGNAYALLVNLLDWSKTQLRNYGIKPTRFEIEKLVAEVFDVCSGAAKTKEIELVKSIDMNTELFADRNMISTVIRNLVSNAIKYTPRNGVVSLIVHERKNEVRIEVIDKGVGIKKEDMHKLFDVGANFTLPGTDKEAGTGLGLILCKEFIEKHNGKIFVKSEPGKGSVFSFSLPLHLNS